MGVPAIGSRTSGSYGVVKADGNPVTDETEQLPAGEYNRTLDGLIAAEAAIGLESAPAVGSLEQRIRDAVARLVLLEQAPPTVNTSPAISSPNTPALDGDVLTRIAGTYNGDPVAVVTVEYWARGGVPIAGTAAMDTYTVDLAFDSAAQITVVERAENSEGFILEPSAPVTVETEVAVVLAAALGGDFEVGGDLTVIPGVYSDAGAGRSYLWYFDDVLQGLSGVGPYTVLQANAGQAIRVEEVVDRASGSGTATFDVLPNDGVIVPYVTAVPTVAQSPGPVVAGQTLNVTPATFDGAVSVAHQWEYQSNPGVSVAPAGDYVVQEVDAGEFLVYVGGGTNPGGTTRAESAATEVSPDFRLGVFGRQASFRRASDDSNLITVVDGPDLRVQYLEDILPQAFKTVDNIEYWLNAPSATQRIRLGPGLSMLWTAGASEQLANDTTVADLITSLGKYTVYLVGDFGPATGNPLVILNYGAFSELVSIAQGTAGGGTYRHICNNTISGNGFIASPDIDGTGVNVIAITCTENVSQKTYVDGALFDTEPAPQTVMPTLHRVVWGDYGANPDFDGTMYEIFICVEEHDATTVATVSAALAAWYGLTL